MKTHFRKVFKSDHLGCADLEEYIEKGSDLIFTIKNCRQEFGCKVAGKKIDANIAYFSENIKPLVLNATNSKTMKKLTGSPFVEDWSNVVIQLYIDSSASLMGSIVGGVRINQNKVFKQKKVLEEENKTLWNNAKLAYKRDGNFDEVTKRILVSEDNKKKIIEQISNEK